MKSYQLAVYVPLTHAEAVRTALAENNAGAIGNYDSCSFTTVGVGRFRPLKGAHPAIGSIGQLEVLEEAKIECFVQEIHLKQALAALIAAHPYEEPAIHLSELIDYKAVLGLNSAGKVDTANGCYSADALAQPVSVVLEGLDGVGKSTVAERLAEVLGAQHMVTPPLSMRSSREWFVEQDGQMRKAFYMVGNFIAGSEMQKEVEEGRHVVLDRYYASTIAYILGKRDLDSPLPTAGDSAYAWPRELYRPTCMIVLVLPEADRIARRQSRTSVDETPEEKLLRENPLIPARINAVYESLGCTRVDIAGADSVEVVVEKVLQAIRKQVMKA